MDNIVRVAFSGSSRFARTIPVTRQDRGVWLQFENVDVPDTFQVHFSHTRANNGTAKTWMGTKKNGVLIPDEYLASGKSVYAWIFVQEDDSGMTKYMAEIPVHSKPTVTDDPPTPVQESAWDQAIEELNGVLDDAKAAVSHYPMIQDGTWWVWDVEEQGYVDTGYTAAGRDGLDGLDGRDGRDGQDGAKGDKGVTYTPVVDANGVISWTNDGNLPNPKPRNITGPQGQPGQNGAHGTPGAPGADGFSPTVEVEEVESGHKITITDKNGDKTFYVMDGSGSSGGEEESGGSLPSGGTAGDILTKTASGAAWVTPASNLDGDNTRPITAAAVNTIVGNIDALLATI